MPISGMELQTLRKKKNMIQQQLAEAVGVSKTTVVDWEKGRYFPEGENLTKLAGVLEVSSSYLLGETDDPAPAKDRRQRLNVGINLDDPKTLAHVLDQLRERKIKTRGLIDDDPEPTIPDQIDLPIIDQGACAGKGFDYGDVEAVAQEWLPFPILKMGGPVGPKKPYFVRVEGDSMTGVGIRDGMLVLINPNVDVLNGNTAYIRWRGRCSIKGFIQYANGDIELRPANPNYKSIRIAAEDLASEEFKIMGKVVRWVDDGVPRDVV